MGKTSMVLNVIIILMIVGLILSVPFYTYRITYEVTVKISSYEINKMYFVSTHVHSYGKAWYFMGEYHFDVNCTYHILYRRGFPMSTLLEATKVG